jgi:drug/metabolite transporter (DMT)-like permease
MTSHKPLHLKTFLLILVMVIAGPLGNVLLSKGMKHAGNLAVWPPSDALHTALRVFGTGSIWLGVASLLTFFLANLLVLTWADYSFVLPASSMGYGVVALLGYFMLGEPVSALRWLGIAVICLGVFVVGQTSPRSPERSLERSPQSPERSLEPSPGSLERS